jgi:hypothetical protein
MAVSDFFGQAIPKLLTKKMTQIYKSKPLNLAGLSKKYALNLDSLNLHEESPQIERIAFLAKTFKSRQYSVECLITKRNKLLSRIRENLKFSNLSIEDLFSNTNFQEV